MSSQCFIILLYWLLNANDIYAGFMDREQEWNITISNATVDKNPFYFWWNKCVGSGHASLLLRSDWRQYMRNAHDAIGFQYVRAHGILMDDVGVVNGIDDYSFINIDKIYEFLLSIDMKPYVEIGFTPRKFTVNASETKDHYEAITAPPYSYDLWYHFIQEWMQHLVDYFGIDEVSKWKFEVWNGVYIHGL